MLLGFSVAVSLPPLLVTVRLQAAVHSSESVKVTLSLHVVQAHGRSRSIAPLIPNLGTRWRRMVGHTPRPLYPQSGLNVLSRDGQTDILPVPRIFKILKMDILKQILMNCDGLL